MVFGNDLKRGVPYYHKAIETAPEVYNIRFDYFTTLQEIIPNENYRTPELSKEYRKKGREVQKELAKLRKQGLL